MTKRPSFNAFFKKALKDPAVKAEYDRLAPEFELIEQFIVARKKAKCSQAELAKRLEMQQPAIARLERSGYINTSVANLAKYADALGYSLKVTLQAKKTSVVKKKS